MICIVFRRVTAPLLVPNTPDCDYANGEELLDENKILSLKNSYNNYNLIDYEHQFTQMTSPYYMTNVGMPVKLFVSEKSISYKDTKGNIIETPKGTLWGSMDIFDERMIEKVDKGELSAFSVTVAEKKDADYVMNEYNRLSLGKQSIKSSSGENEVDDKIYSRINDIYSKLTTKRHLIKDIEDPVILTVSLTSLPCVSKARFCENILSAQKSNKQGDIMEKHSQEIETSKKEESIDETTFFNRLKKNLISFKNENKPQEEKKEMNKEEVTEIVNENVKASIDNFKDDMTASLKSGFDELREQTKKEIDALKEEMTSKNNEENEEESQIPANEEETNKQSESEADIKGKGNKSFKHEEKPAMNKSSQIQNHNDGIGAGKTIPRKSINERDLLMQMIKGKNFSNKSLQDIDISYKGLGIIPESLETSQFYNLIHPALKDAFSDTYTEETTQKLILPTNQYALYMREMLSTDPLMDDANFRIDYEVADEERVMYALRLDEDPTQDGIMEENYYFDNPDITAARIEATKDKLEPQPVRALLHISDRQIKQNVFGDNLLTKSLDIVRYRYNEGIARINYFGDTAFDDNVDVKFARRDGLLKQAGSKLISDDVGSGDNTFNIDDGIDQVFKQMFRKLPFEAQKASYFNLYVPPFVYEAYREYYLNNDKINFLGNITDDIPLQYKKITVKEAPILADTKGVELYDDCVPMLLTAPTNTHFIASRALRIEPERMASTGSTKYWYTGDYDVRYAIPEYAVTASISKEEYTAL